MTDLNGGKIVLRDTDKKTVDGVLDRLIPAIKSNSVELLEIENKRPKVVKGLPETEACKYDYASINMLKKLTEIQNTTCTHIHTSCILFICISMQEKLPVAGLAWVRFSASRSNIK